MTDNLSYANIFVPGGNVWLSRRAVRQEGRIVGDVYWLTRFVADSLLDVLVIPAAV